MRGCTPCRTTALGLAPRGNPSSRSVRRFLRRMGPQGSLLRSSAQPQRTRPFHVVREPEERWLATSPRSRTRARPARQDLRGSGKGSKPPQLLELRRLQRSGLGDGRFDSRSARVSATGSLARAAYQPRTPAPPAKARATKLPRARTSDASLENRARMADSIGLALPALDEFSLHQKVPSSERIACNRHNPLEGTVGCTTCSPSAQVPTFG